MEAVVIIGSWTKHEIGSLQLINGIGRDENGKRPQAMGRIMAEATYDEYVKFAQEMGVELKGNEHKAYFYKASVD